MLNRVVEEGFGYTEKEEKSLNLEARKQIMLMRGVANYIKSSPITNVSTTRGIHMTSMSCLSFAGRKSNGVF
jgi:hypothetical protein